MSRLSASIFIMKSILWERCLCTGRPFCNENRNQYLRALVSFNHENSLFSSPVSFSLRKCDFGSFRVASFLRIFCLASTAVLRTFLRNNNKLLRRRETERHEKRETEHDFGHFYSADFIIFSLRDFGYARRSHWYLPLVLGLWWSVK